MICDICDNVYTGETHNAEPLIENGKCCDKCNVEVIRARLSLIKKKFKCDDCKKNFDPYEEDYAFCLDGTYLCNACSEKEDD